MRFCQICWIIVVVALVGITAALCLCSLYCRKSSQSIASRPSSQSHQRHRKRLCVINYNKSRKSCIEQATEGMTINAIPLPILLIYFAYIAQGLFIQLERPFSCLQSVCLILCSSCYLNHESSLKLSPGSVGLDRARSITDGRITCCSLSLSLSRIEKL